LDWNATEVDFQCCNFRVSKRIKLQNRLILLRWDSLCLAVNLQRKTYQISHRGHYGGGSLNVLGENPTVDDKGIMIIGRLQRQHGGGLTEAFRGSIARFTLLEQALLGQDMIDFISDCDVVFGSSLLGINIPVDLTQWTAKGDNVNDTEVNATTFCNQPSWIFMLPGRHEHNVSKGICHNLGGHLAYPESTMESRELEKSFKDNIQACLNIYGSWLWIDAYEIYDNGSWSVVMRRNRNIQNTQCISLKPSNSNTWASTPCDEKLCAACELITNPHLTLRGGCKAIVDRQFTFTYDENEQPKLRGLLGTEIYWNSRQRGNWYMKESGNPDDIGELEKSINVLSSLLPIGLHAWNFENFTECTSTEVMLLSLCDEHNFACQDGLHCFPWNVRCNFQKDCPDGSDEMGCPDKLLKFPVMAHLPPPPLDANVTFFMLLGVHHIEIDGMSLQSPMQSAFVTVTIQWFDPRVGFYNLRSPDTPLHINSSIWKPHIGGVRSENYATQLSYRHGYQKPSLTVVRSGGLRDGSLHSQNVEYSGDRNAFQLYSEYQAEYPCIPNLWYFPFDSNLCHFSLTFQ
ncbi:hypothetical protein SK128_018219, partial [Halocaridina rubra]